MADVLDGRTDEPGVASPERATLPAPPLSRRDRLNLRRQRRRRRNIWIGLILIGAALTIALVGGYLGQESWEQRTATIDAQSCHPAGDGAGGTFTACTLDVIYTDPSGRSRAAHLTGVDSSRIRANTISVWFSNSSSQAAIGPPQRTSVSAFVALAACAWFIVGAIAMIVAIVSRRKARGNSLQQH